MAMQGRRLSRTQVLAWNAPWSYPGSRSRPRGQVSSRYFLMPLGISAVHMPGITSCAGHDHRKRAARRLRAL